MAKQDSKDVEHVVTIIGKRKRMHNSVVVDYSQTYPNESAADKNRGSVESNSGVP